MRYEVKLPDIGEGIAEAELSEWHVEAGDVVAEDEILAAVMTDKAAVEVPTARAGKVLELRGEVGDMLPIGSVLIVLDVEGTEATDPPAETPKPEVTAAYNQTAKPPPTRIEPGSKPLASPAVRKRAREAGIDLTSVSGSGPAGRITHEDLDKPGRKTTLRTEVTETRITGMRRKVAEKMALANARIPHITIVEEVEMEALESLRATLNAQYTDTRSKLTVLPFIARALVRAVDRHPVFNSHFDDDEGLIRSHGAVHIGVATQTDAGLTVPVLRHAEAAGLWDAAAEIARLAGAARDGSIQLEDLKGSTITITSLGPLGAIATTPIINHPEVTILGVNRMQTRPVWDGQAFQPRKMMNLSASFDHRVIDGYDAALFVQTIKGLLEQPALLFMED
ncbi:MAG: dihydrolipoamide acetyltransferase family protein [Pseudomonadota bacterium]